MPRTPKVSKPERIKKFRQSEYPVSIQPIKGARGWAFRLEWKPLDGGTRDRDYHTCHSEEEADQAALRIHKSLLQGIAPPYGRKTRVEAASNPTFRGGVLTLPDIEESWANNWEGTKLDSLRDARYNLNRYAWVELPTYKAEIDEPDGETICLARIPARTMTRADLTRWLRALHFKPLARGTGTLGDSTRALALRNLKAVLNYGLRTEMPNSSETYLTRNVWQGVSVTIYDAEAKEKFETEDEWVVVAKHLSPVWLVVATVMAYSGCRFGEVRALTVDVLDFGNRRIYVNWAVNQHGNRTRPKTPSSNDWIEMHPALEPMLLKYVKGLDNRSRGALLFPGSRGGKHISNSGLNSALRRACEATGAGKVVTSHGLRHSIGTWLTRAGVPLPDVMATMRQKDVRTTLQYTKATDASRKAAMNTLTGVGIILEP